MTEDTPARHNTPRLQDRIIDWVVARPGLVVILLLMLVALVMRLWNLGDMALHHDESLHATYSWYLYSGDGYQHHPLMHGPFLFHTGATIYFLFGDTEMTARLLPAVFGAALVGMPYLLRRQIGMPAVIIAAVMLLISPTLFYYGRFYRNELYMAVWTLGIVICVWRYLDDLKMGWLYAMAALMAFSFASKEVTFITVAILLVFVNLLLAIEFGKRREGETNTDVQVALRVALIFPVAWLIAAAWPLLGQGKKFGHERLPPIGDVMIVLGTLSLPQFAAGIQVLPFVENHGYAAPEENTLKVATVASLLIACSYIGLMWRPSAWLIAAACFFVPYVLLYTTFFTNPDGFFSGIWGSLDYWLAQHGERRGDQPIYYYALMTPLYEFMPLLIGAAGAVWLALRGDGLRRWLLFWVFWIFVGLSIAGEKMPWLEVHIVLPLIFVAAVALARVIEVLGLSGKQWYTAGVVAAATAIGVLIALEGGDLAIGAYLIAAALASWALYTLVRGEGEAILATVRGALTSRELQLTAVVVAGAALAVALLSVTGLFDIWFAVWLLALLPIVLVGHLLGGLMVARRGFGRVLLVVGVAVLFTLTARASYYVAYVNADTPVEMMVYTQTSPDIPMLRDRIDALAERSGLGRNLPIVVDTADSFAWPWAWYLRDYNSVSFSAIGADYEPPPGTVLLINRSNVSRIDASQYAQAPYKHRWWFLETYRGLDFREAARVLTDSERRSALVSFFFHRRSAETDTGSIDGVAFFPNDLAAFDEARGPAPPPREPDQLPDGRIVLGSSTAEPGRGVEGEFWQPAGLAVDAAGNIWVADSRNHRIQKFDASGNFITAFGRPGPGQGAFNEPWGVAVDDDGIIYVADTWNHRIQKFSPELEFRTSWGVPGASVEDTKTLFGPRDVALDADANVWITDTGNQRVLGFTPDGIALTKDLPKPEDDTPFAEPVGLAFDTEGRLLVADAWNGRVVRFDSDMQPVDSFEVAWTSQAILTKPYLVALADGRVLVALPEKGKLCLYTEDGEASGVWQPNPDGLTVGVAALADGGFVFSDVARNEVQIVPGELVDSLFE